MTKEQEIGYQSTVTVLICDQKQKIFNYPMKAINLPFKENLSHFWL